MGRNIPQANSVSVVVSSARQRTLHESTSRMLVKCGKFENNFPHLILI